MFIINIFSRCFGHHYAHLQENKACVTVHGVLRCNKRGKVDISCNVFFVGYYTPPHKKDITVNIYLSPLVTAQHTTYSNTRLVLLKMGIIMPETCWKGIDNKHLTVASCWFALSLHILSSYLFIYTLQFHCVYSVFSTDMWKCMLICYS